MNQKLNQQQRFDFAPDLPAVYPEAAGWTEPTTSREAALTIDAATLRGEVLDWLKARGPHTPDETASGLMRSVLSVRPRFTELKKLGMIEKAYGQDEKLLRRRNASGLRAQVWKAKR